jgi:hypothetical protein
MWWMLRRQAHELPGGLASAGLIGIMGIVLVAGLSVFTETWLFGVAIWPGLTMLVSAAERWLADRNARLSRHPEV